MRLGKIIGSVWASQKDSSISGGKLFLVTPIDRTGTPNGDDLVAIDAIGAGPGETILYITSREAIIGYTGYVDSICPVDAAIIGIVDEIHQIPEGASSHEHSHST